jgi:hypothetical protein
MAALEQVFVLFLLIVVGYVIKKMKIITNDMNRDVSNLVLYVTLPAFLITAMNFSFSPELLEQSGKLITISFGVYALAIGISYLAPKVLGIKGRAKDIYQFVIVFANVGFMGYPVTKTIFGDIGVFYAAIYNLPFNLLVWTIGIYFLTRRNEEGNKSFNLKSFLNPGLVAITTGFLLFLFSVELPYFIYKPLSMLGDATTPLSMIFIGSMLADVKATEIFSDRKAFMLSVVRLLILPFIVMIILKGLGLGYYLVGIPVVITAMPAATNAAIMASKFGSDYHFASKVIFISTLISIFTIPIVVMFIK